MSLSAGEAKKLPIDIAWYPYATGYTVTTTVEPASTVVELSKSNNVLLETETFSNPYSPYSCD